MEAQYILDWGNVLYFLHTKILHTNLTTHLKYRQNEQARKYTKKVITTFAFYCSVHQIHRLYQIFEAMKSGFIIHSFVHMTAWMLTKLLWETFNSKAKTITLRFDEHIGSDRQLDLCKTMYKQIERRHNSRALLLLHQESSKSFLFHLGTASPLLHTTVHCGSMLHSATWLLEREAWRDISNFWFAKV